MNLNLLIAGFGGQGILFVGKFLTYVGLLQNRQVSWLPSYGPEMRGGTANCSVILSDAPIGSPIVSAPDYLVVMNLPSFDRYEPTLQSGGALFSDSILVPRKSVRADITVHSLPATQLAELAGLAGLANMVMLGRVIRETGLCTREEISTAMSKVVPERKRDLFDKNLQAIQIGLTYEG